MQVDIKDEYIDVTKNGNTIRISSRHIVYVRDIAMGFDYYFSSVFGDSKMLDFSKPAQHNIVGFDKIPIMFPSFTEPTTSTKQYIDFAKLEAGMTVLDLGAYSGLTSIMFSEVVGKGGRVVAVEADAENIECAVVNINRYRDYSGHDIRLLYGAVWNHGNGVTFSNECNMGSSAVKLVGARGSVSRVKTFTLSDIAKMEGLQNVDFIKCDIEGAESVIFEDADFFRLYSPRIMIEVHNVNGISTAQKCINDLERYGYTITEYAQPGVRHLLLRCVKGRN